MWPFRKQDAPDRRAAADRAASPGSPGPDEAVEWAADEPGWASLPTLQPVSAATLRSIDEGFGSRLASWSSPALVRPMSHAQSGQAPAGEAQGLAESTTTPAHRSQPRPAELKVSGHSAATGIQRFPHPGQGGTVVTPAPTGTPPPVAASAPSAADARPAPTGAALPTEEAAVRGGPSAGAEPTMPESAPAPGLVSEPGAAPVDGSGQEAPDDTTAAQRSVVGRGSDERGAIGADDVGPWVGRPDARAPWSVVGGPVGRSAALEPPWASTVETATGDRPASRPATSLPLVSRAVDIAGLHVGDVAPGGAVWHAAPAGQPDPVDRSLDPAPPLPDGPAGGSAPSGTDRQADGTDGGADSSDRGISGGQRAPLDARRDADARASQDLPGPEEPPAGQPDPLAAPAERRVGLGRPLAADRLPPPVQRLLTGAGSGPSDAPAAPTATPTHAPALRSWGSSPLGPDGAASEAVVRSDEPPRPVDAAAPAFGPFVALQRLPESPGGIIAVAPTPHRPRGDTSAVTPATVSAPDRTSGAASARGPVPDDTSAAASAPGWPPHGAPPVSEVADPGRPTKPSGTAVESTATPLVEPASSIPRAAEHAPVVSRLLEPIATTTSPTAPGPRQPGPASAAEAPAAQSGGTVLRWPSAAAAEPPAGGAGSAGGAADGPPPWEATTAADILTTGGSHWRLGAAGQRIVEPGAPLTPGTPAPRPPSPLSTSAPPRQGPAPAWPTPRPLAAASAIREPWASDRWHHTPDATPTTTLHRQIASGDGASASIAGPPSTLPSTSRRAPPPPGPGALAGDGLPDHVDAWLASGAVQRAIDGSFTFRPQSAESTAPASAAADGPASPSSVEALRQATIDPGPDAQASAAPPPEPTATPARDLADALGPGDLDELARRLYDRIRVRLQQELRHDHERLGLIISRR